jgi:hypothetical protein
MSLHPRVEEDDGFTCWDTLLGIAHPQARREARRGELYGVRPVHLALSCFPQRVLRTMSMMPLRRSRRTRRRAIHPLA